VKAENVASACVASHSVLAPRGARQAAFGESTLGGSFAPVTQYERESVFSPLFAKLDCSHFGSQFGVLSSMLQQPKRLQSDDCEIPPAFRICVGNTLRCATPFSCHIERLAVKVKDRWALELFWAA